MTKYVITTGKCIIVAAFQFADSFNFEVFSNGEPLTFDKIGDAMKYAAKINELLGNACFKVESIEVGNSENDLI